MKRGHGLWLLAVALLVVVPLLAACAVTTTTPLPTTTPPLTTPPPTTTPPVTPSVEVEINSGGYIPEAITIPVGTAVIWVHRDRSEDTAWWRHTVTSETGLFDSGNLFFGDTFSYTFTEKGTFNYFSRHLPFWRGSVIVE